MKRIIYSGFTRTWEDVKHNQKQNIIEDGDELLFYTTSEPVCEFSYNWIPMGQQLEQHFLHYSTNAAGETSIINTLNQWRNRRDAFKLFSEDSDKTHVIARTDTNFFEKIDFTTEPNTVYIPSGQDYGGLNDQFAFGDYAAMSYYTSLYEHFDKYWNEGVRFHPETMLAHHLRNTRVIRIPSHIQIYRR